ncbi:hypothetical protein C8R45DRAFT_1089059 [Mycena sanguinolenta]|nr:hypothetical protein C8R45DRAFT_1089059 [Mycena sanguinolenta]
MKPVPSAWRAAHKSKSQFLYIQSSSSDASFDGSLALAGELAPSSSHRENRHQHLDSRQRHLDSVTCNPVTYHGAFPAVLIYKMKPVPSVRRAAHKSESQFPQFHSSSSDASFDGSLALTGELAPSSLHRGSRHQHLDIRQQDLDSST